MKIEDILKANQPDVYRKLNRNRKTKKKKSSNKNFSSSFVEGLMKSRSYKRARGGAMKQVN